MKRITTLSALLLFGMGVQSAFADYGKQYYAAGLCDNPKYHCVKIKRGQGWKSLFPDPVQRDLVQRVNRTYNYLWAGRVIAIPKDLEGMTLFNISPFPLEVKKFKNKTIIVDQERLAWGAYNSNGKLVRWGPISSGKNYCRDVGRSCNTKTGVFHIFNKKNRGCRSNIFPVGRGGSKMPYCMFYYRGFALHGSSDVPGHRDSHGCIRLFTQDAKWLNQEFVELSTEENNFRGTTVIVQDVKRDRSKRSRANNKNNYRANAQQYNDGRMKYRKRRYRSNFYNSRRYQRKYRRSHNRYRYNRQYRRRGYNGYSR